MRYRAFLRDRYRAMLGYMGGIIGIIGLLHLTPLLLLPFYPQELPYAGSFLWAGLPLVAFGGVCWRLFTPREPVSLTTQEGAVIMFVVWSTACLMGTIPFMQINGMTFLHALFESTSGYTTTGQTVIDLSDSPRLVLMFRSITHFAGGAGFAIIALSAAATSLAMGVSAAEGRTEQLAPHVRRSATIVLILYSGYILFGIIGLRLAGMGWFDAINHSIAAVATGGFSTQPNSIGHWNNRAIEAVVIILMILGTINFLIAYTVMRGRPGVLWRSAEVRSQTLMIGLATLVLTTVTTSAIYSSQSDSIRVAFFEVISAITSTGFALGSPVYAGWNDFGLLILALLMAVGGGTGSTSGGIKQLRIYVLYKSALWEIQRAFLPKHTVNEPAIWQGIRKELLSDKQVRQAAQFVGVYLLLFFMGSATLTAFGYPLAQSMFEFSAALGNAGMSTGIVGAEAPTGVLIVQMVAMLLGRLEIFVLIVGILKLGRDSYDMVISAAGVASLTCGLSGARESATMRDEIGG